MRKSPPQIRVCEMGEALVARYWCHVCSQMVSPVMEVEMKCPFCDSGFVEEVEGRGDFDSAEMVSSDRSLALLAPLLLGMIGGGGGGGPSRRRRPIRDGEDDDSDQDRSLTSIMRRRRRRSSAIFRLIQDLEDRIQADPDSVDGERERERESDRESLILIDNFNRALILQGSFDNHGQGQDSDGGAFGVSLGDYFLGPGLDILLQHLAENDPNRYGTPPAKKEAVEALSTVKIQESMSCSVCLEDLEIGTEVREMPCKHSFHNGCLLPWLELHSSCPVCRFQLPSDEPKDSNTSGGNGRDGDRGSENRNSSSDAWNVLFPLWENSDSNSAYNPSSSSSSGDNPDDN